MAKRCMTKLDDDALEGVKEFMEIEERSESQMIAILVKEGLAVRRNGAGEKRSAPRTAQPSDM